MKSWKELKSHYLVTFWKPIPAVIAAGVLSAYYFGITGTFWAVTGEFTRWGGHILQFLGQQPETWAYFKVIGLSGTPLDRVDGLMILGMFAGILASALWANNIKLRVAKQPVRILQALLGGFIAGFGARLAMGCNLAAFFTGIPQFSLHAWFFALATALGTWFGLRVTTLPILRAPVRLLKPGEVKLEAPDPKQAKRRFWIGTIVFLLFLCFALTKTVAMPKLGLAAVFGLCFGMLIERAQICFTSAFRDLWLTGRSEMARAILLGMAVSTMGVYSYVELGVTPKILWAGPNALIGGVLFGFGIVVAGGCETGWMYRAVEGQVHYWWVGLGNILGATVLAATWDVLGPLLATPYDKVNLLMVFGHPGGLLLTYCLLLLAFLAVVLWERRFFKDASQ